MLEGTADSSGTGQPEVASALSAADPQIDPADEESNSDSDTDSDNFDYEASFCDSNTDSDNFNYEESFCDRYRRKWVCHSATQTEKEIQMYLQGITLPEVTLSMLTEIGQAESSIKVPKQWSYLG